MCLLHHNDITINNNVTHVTLIINVNIYAAMQEKKQTKVCFGSFNSEQVHAANRARRC